VRDNKYIMFESEKMESIKEVENNWEQILSDDGVFGKKIVELSEEIYEDNNPELAHEINDILHAMRLRFSKENNSLDDVKDWIKNREESIDEESEKYAIEKEACTRVFSIVR